MDRTAIIGELNQEITRLTQARDLLLVNNSVSNNQRAISLSASIDPTPHAETAGKRARKGMSEEGKARVVAALRKRWADKKRLDSVSASSAKKATKRAYKKSAKSTKLATKSASKRAAKKSPAKVIKAPGFKVMLPELTGSSKE